MASIELIMFYAILLVSCGVSYGIDEFERRKMEALGYTWGGTGWVTDGFISGNTMTVWPAKRGNNAGDTGTNGYGSGYVNVPGQPPSLAGNIRGEKSLQQIQQEQAYFEQVTAEAERKLAATQAKIQALSAQVNNLSGADRLRKQAELAVESVEETTLEMERDGARANAIHAYLSTLGRLSAGGLATSTREDYRRDSENRLTRDTLKNGLVIKEQEKQRRVAELNRLNQERAALDAGQDIREITAAREVQEAGNTVNALNQERQRLEADVNSKNALSAQERVMAEDFKQRRKKIVSPWDDMRQREYETSMNTQYYQHLNNADQLASQVVASQAALKDVNSRLTDAQNQQGVKQHQLEAVRAQLAAEKAEAERRREEACQKEEAARKAKEETERLAQEIAEKNRVRERLWQKVNIISAPAYTPEMKIAAETSMAGVGVMALGNTAGSVQLSSAGSGVWTAAGEAVEVVATAIGRDIAALGAIVTASTAGLMVAAASTILFSAPVGQGSDRVPGQDLLALNAQMMGGSIEPGATNANLPYRGNLVLSNGQFALQLLKTGDGLPAAVQLLTAVRDPVTGLDRVTVPATKAAPSRTILINPVPVPSTPSNTGNSAPVPVTPVHTGTEVKPVDTLVTTVTPARDFKDLQDFIYWRPDAAGTGVEPVYVMFSSPYGETNAKGKYSGRDFHTEKAGGPILDLDWRTATINREGVDKVKLHTGRFGESLENKVMIERLEKILSGELAVTDTDKRFYTHEIRELERYRALGVPDSNTDKSVWNNAHTATLEDYKINEKNDPLYTPEAIAAEAAQWKKY